MAVDLQRQFTFPQPPSTRRHWWQRVITTRDALMIPRGYIQTGANNIPALVTGTPFYPAQYLPADAQLLMLTAENQTVRWLMADSPSLTYGNPLYAQQSVFLTVKDPDILTVVGIVGGAVLNIQAWAVHSDA